MKDFVFEFPTKIVFGKNAQAQVGELTAEYGHRAMIVYGSDRVYQSGLLTQITMELENAGVSWVLFGGIRENPTIDKVREGIYLVEKNEIDVLIAVGGGSVVDTTKAISLGSMYDNDVWDLYEGKAKAQETLPIGVVLTAAATASEANSVSVIWNKAEGVKKALNDPKSTPKFALLNPELTYTVPARVTAAGSLDIFAHAFERYFMKEQDGTLRDFLCEAIMKTVTIELPATLKKPDSYEHRSQLMWAATMAHSDMIGKEGDFACHALSHVFTDAFELAHGAGLAMIMPAWCEWMSKQEPEKMEKFWVNVWNASGDSPKKIAKDGVKKFRKFVEKCGLAPTLGEAGFSEIDVDKLALMAVGTEDGHIGGGFYELGYHDVRKILKLCM